MVKVMMVGAGRGGLRVLKALHGHSDIEIVYVIDKFPDAPGMMYATAQGIPMDSHYDHVFPWNNGQLDVILEATGDPAVYADLVQRAPVGATVIPGAALKFFDVFIQDKLQWIEKLRAGRRELERIIDATRDGLVGIDADGKINLLNAAAEKLLGLKRNRVIGQLAHLVIPNSRLIHVLESGDEELNQVQQVGDIEIVTNRIPVYDETGQIAGAIASFRDVTDLRALAAEVTNLREIQTLLEAIIESTQDAISVVDAEGRGLMINSAYTRLTGLRQEQVLNQPADVDIAEGESMHLQVLKTMRPVRNVPMKVGPLRREVLVDVAPILVNGELRGSVGVIHDVSEIQRLTNELARANQLLRTVAAKHTFEEIVAESPAMLVAVEQAKRAAQTPATVLLRGESGTGKELFAHAIHHDSNRRYHPFVRVNCAAISENLLESELFGYEEGAFTGARRGGRKGLFEEASRGTLFLDEVGDMTPTTQAKLLRALQEREIVRVGGTRPIPIDVRVIAATHVNLEQAISAGRFREDLYYRLNVVPIVIPPLRYRLEDIRSLALRMIEKLSLSYGRNVSSISQAAVDILCGYSWPGNVRELENTIGRAMIHMRYQDTVLDAYHLPVLGQGVVQQGAPLPNARMQRAGKSLSEILRETERMTIATALEESGGNKTEAAKRLGVSIRTLYYKLGEMSTDKGGSTN